MRNRCSWSLSLVVLALSAPAVRAQTACGNFLATVAPNPAPYGQPVTVTLTNVGGTTELMPSPCAFESIDLVGGGPVFTPACLAVLTPVPPGGQLVQVWDQKGNCEDQVDPGLYSITVNPPVGGPCSLPLTISPCPSGSISTFGTGCNSGIVCFSPPSLTADDCPQIGATITLRVANGFVTSPALLALGVSNTSWLGIPLPFDLGSGCFLRVSLDVLLPTTATNETGRALFPVQIPADPLLVGQTVYAQGATGTASNLAVTNGLALTIG
ncbi:MAG: hypothetical protein L0323_21515 [Planctomycetes bacterium]|nr:hypothetical protein [Planctomycetota bacterium]